MKPLRWILSMLLIAALVASMAGFTLAEDETGEAGWQADILKLMDPSHAPRTTTLRCNPALLPCVTAFFVMINRETILLEKVSLKVKDLMIGAGFGFTLLVYLVRMIFFDIP